MITRGLAFAHGEVHLFNFTEVYIGPAAPKEGATILMVAPQMLA